MKKYKAIGEIVLEIRGCLEFLAKDDLFTKDLNYIKDKLKQSKELIQTYSLIKQRKRDFIQRSWLNDSIDCAKDLNLIIKIVEEHIIQIERSKSNLITLKFKPKA